jgi:hypothetical protein
MNWEAMEQAEARAKAILGQVDERTQGNLRLLAQGARAALDPDAEPLTAAAYERAVADVERAARRVAQAEIAAGAVHTPEQLPAQLARAVVRDIAAAHERGRSAGRTAA